MNATQLNTMRLSGLSTLEARVARRMLEMTIGGSAAIAGVVVTRWTAELWEVGSFDKCREKVGEAAQSLLAMVDCDYSGAKKACDDLVTYEATGDGPYVAIGIGR